MSVPVTDRTRIQEPAAPVLPSAAAIARLNPLGGQDVAIAGGFWADRLRVNRERGRPTRRSRRSRLRNATMAT